MKQPDRELRQLTDAWHDGTISPEDALRLERRLLKDESALSYFFEMAEIESALPEAAKVSSASAVPMRMLPRRLWWATAASAAAAFIAGIFVNPLVWQSIAVGPRPALAMTPDAPAVRISEMLQVSWDGGTEAEAVELVTSGGESRIQSGLLELSFGSGSRTIIEGPARFQVLGSNAIQLSRGRLVADVPRGGGGFTVSYPGGAVVYEGAEYGVEFGVAVDDVGESVNIGVFRGEVEFRPRSVPERRVRLPENHAVIANNQTVRSIPLIHQKFARRVPSHEFAWQLSSSASSPQIREYDVSQLIWAPGSYRVICKWMHGLGMQIESAELLLDGEQMAADRHLGVTGDLMTQDNIYELNLSPDAYRRGLWTLRLHVRSTALPGVTGEATGVILVEKGAAAESAPSDFVGSWEYLHDGIVYCRTFLADGTASLTMDGKEYAPFMGSHWEVTNGVLRLWVADPEGPEVREDHFLRNRDTLIFANRPYRDASRVKK